MPLFFLSVTVCEAAAAVKVNNIAKYRTVLSVYCSLSLFVVVFVVVCFNDGRHVCEKTDISFKMCHVCKKQATEREEMRMIRDDWIYNHQKERL